MIAVGLLAACAETPKPGIVTGGSDGAGSASASAGWGGRYKIGKPYQIKGVWYYPAVDYDYAEEGVASWYGPGFHGKSTANGETYDQNDLTAAHRTLPMPSLVRVTNLENGRAIVLRVNDRGPFYGDRIIDVSRRASQLLGFHGAGTARVHVEILGEESRQIAEAMGASPPATLVAAAPLPVQAPYAETQYAEPTPVVAADAELPAPEPVYAEPAVSPPAVVAAEDLPPPEPVAAAVPDAYAYATSLPEPEPTTPAFVPSYASLPVDARVMYVQAGAFADPDRVAAVRRRLSPIGPVVTSPSRVGGLPVTRIRIGPLDSDAEAERVLASVSRAGFPDSRLVFE